LEAGLAEALGAAFVTVAAGLAAGLAAALGAAATFLSAPFLAVD